MVVVSRLCVLALAACLAFAVPVSADEGEEEGGRGEPECEECREPPQGNETPPQGPPPPPPQEPPAGPPGPPLPPVTPPPPSLPNAPQAIVIKDLRKPGTPCDFVRPTGDKPRISVNPVLGILTVDPACLHRWVDAKAPRDVVILPP